MMRLNYPLVIYDGQCPLCLRFKQALSMIDSKNEIHFISLHDDELYTALPQLSKEKCFETIHVLQDESTVFQGSEALEFLTGIIPAVSKFSWLIQSNMGQKALDVFYERVNGVRQKHLSKCSCCKGNR